MINCTVTPDVSISYGICERFIERLKRIFSNHENVTKEHIVDNVASVEEIISEKIDDKLDEKIRDSDIATKKDIELVRSDMKLEISQSSNRTIGILSGIVLASIFGAFCIFTWIISNMITNALAHH